MNSRDRVIKALELSGEPDRVPSFFEGMMGIFKDNFFKTYEDDIEDSHVCLGLFGDLTIYKFYGVDSVWLHSSPIKMKKLDLEWDKIKLEEGLSISRWGTISKSSIVMGRPHSYYRGGYLNTKEKWQEWIDAGYFDFEIDNEWIRKWEKAYKEALEQDIFLIPVDTTWEKVREGMGMAGWAKFVRKDKDFVKKILDRFYKIYEESAKALADTGFEVVTWADDAAYKERVMIKPELWRELIVPHYKNLNDIAKKNGQLTFYHSDGFTEPFFEGLIDSGFNGVQSLEPAAGMDLKHLKETYGDRLCLIGNIDVSRLLPYGTPEEIIAEVKYEIEVAAKGGGYIFGPCTDVIDSIPPKNIKIMMDALLKYGKYR